MAKRQAKVAVVANAGGGPLRAGEKATLVRNPVLRDVRLVPIAEVVGDAAADHRDGNGDLARLAESLKAVGLLEPIGVRPEPRALSGPDGSTSAGPPAPMTAEDRLHEARIKWAEAVAEAIGPHLNGHPEAAVLVTVLAETDAFSYGYDRRAAGEERPEAVAQVAAILNGPGTLLDKAVAAARLVATHKHRWSESVGWNTTGLPEYAMEVSGDLLAALVEALGLEAPPMPTIDQFHEDSVTIDENAEADSSRAAGIRKAAEAKEKP
ncbi:MAG TPA: hypothetical protein VMW52_11005 [Phycisphaerae bacterium]|nr:hypothetical protein [Phycisphaerae bacterium]